MTAGSSIDPAEFLHEHLAQASPDLLRELMQGFIDSLLSADADSVVRCRLRGPRSRASPTAATATATATSRPGSGPWTWRCPSCLRAPTSPKRRPPAPPSRRSTADVGGRYWRPARGDNQGGWTGWCSLRGITGLSRSQVSVMARDLDALARRTFASGQPESDHSGKSSRARAGAADAPTLIPHGSIASSPRRTSRVPVDWSPRFSRAASGTRSLGETDHPFLQAVASLCEAGPGNTPGVTFSDTSPLCSGPVRMRHETLLVSSGSKKYTRRIDGPALVVADMTYRGLLAVERQLPQAAPDRAVDLRDDQLGADLAERRAARDVPRQRRKVARRVEVSFIEPAAPERRPCTMFDHVGAVPQEVRHLRGRAAV